MKKLFNLQLFNNTQKTTSADLSDEMKVYYEKALIMEAEPNLVHDQFGDSYPIPKNGGKSIEFRKFSSLAKATTPLQEGVTPNGTALEVTTVTGEVEQYGAYVEVSDILDMTAIDNVIVQAVKVLGSQAGRTLDTITRDILNGGTNVMRPNDRQTRKDLTANDQLDTSIFFKAAAMLKKMNAPTIDGSYVAIIHPNTACDLMLSTSWIDVHKYADPEAIFEGEIGKLGNIRFVESSEAKIWNDSTCPTGLAVYSTLVLGANAYAKTEITGGGLQTIIKQLGAGDDPLNQRATVGWKATKTAERLVEQYMVRIESTAKTGAAEAAN